MLAIFRGEAWMRTAPRSAPETETRATPGSWEIFSATTLSA